MISVCLCSWNDLEYLKILHGSLKRNTKIPYELIVHDNASEDGTEEWLKENKIKHSKSDRNEGVAAVNYAIEQAKHSIITDANSDMYFLPGWDMEIMRQTKKFKSKKIDKYLISGCLIEPYGHNHEYTISYHGHDHKSFNEQSLLSDFSINYKKYQKENTIQYGHPVTMPKHLWKEIGGVSTEYEYGVGTDHDIPASAYSVGCRNFIRLGNCRIYHFISKTIQKLPKERSDGQDTFRKKWGISVEEFRKRMNINKKYEEVQDGVL